MNNYHCSLEGFHVSSALQRGLSSSCAKDLWSKPHVRQLCKRNFVVFRNKTSLTCVGCYIYEKYAWSKSAVNLSSSETDVVMSCVENLFIVCPALTGSQLLFVHVQLIFNCRFLVWHNVIIISCWIKWIWHFCHRSASVAKCLITSISLSVKDLGVKVLSKKLTVPLQLNSADTLPQSYVNLSQSVWSFWSGHFESPKELTDFEGSAVIRCHRCNNFANKIVGTVFVMKRLTKAALQSAMVHAEWKIAKALLIQ